MTPDLEAHVRSLYLRSGQQKYAIVFRGEGHVEGPFLPPKEALAILRRFRAPEHLPSFRRFAIQLGIDPRRRDDSIQEELARWLWSGRIKLKDVQPPPAHVPIGDDAEAQQAPPPPLAASEEPPPEEQKTPTLTDPRWSMPRAPVGATVQAVFTVSGLKGGESATVTFFESGVDGSNREKSSIKKSLDTTDGDVKVSWSRSADEASLDMEEDQAAGQGGAVAYRFKVEVQGVGSTGPSGPLLLTHSVEVNIENEAEGEGASESDESEIDVTLWDALDEEHHAKVQDGKAKFDGIVVGPFKISLGGEPPVEPSVSSLQWSAPSVTVGDEVELSFAFEGFEDGQEVIVKIYERNADGSATVIDTISTNVSGESGEHRVSWTRSEEDAAADLAEDAAEGDTGPLEYVFSVVAAGSESKDRSDPLRLTQTIVINVPPDEHDDEDDKLDMILVDAAGNEMRAPVSDGKARFEGVVVGPMKIRFAAPNPPAD